eukprot:6249166-Prymnesium_polylepis.1
MSKPYRNRAMRRPPATAKPSPRAAPRKWALLAKMGALTLGTLPFPLSLRATVPACSTGRLCACRTTAKMGARA